ncbi:hypothetical protein EGR_01610 [Echinococcus granulosus]|uniref:Uncharacterized protein n=1 Tax=Echinococcus granulosus TaxID=6210 RepID=W6UQN7_ECHGR|nr:hypothetical protein EGR_01610 [Echinococcus granulosus]EUB63528.1 hypothetical protein EGR_01610 [Echinococcus granulosus]
MRSLNHSNIVVIKTGHFGTILGYRVEDNRESQVNLGQNRMILVNLKHRSMTENMLHYTICIPSMIKLKFQETVYKNKGQSRKSVGVTQSSHESLTTCRSISF